MEEVQKYLDGLDSPTKTELVRIRSVILDLVPDAKQQFSYGMPAFKYKGKYLAGFYAFKDHLSLFPTSQPVELLKHQLGDYKLSKGTIQFTLDNTIPQDLLVTIIHTRKKAIDEG